MTRSHDVQALSDVDIHVYETVASQVVENGVAGFDGVVHASGLSEEEVRGCVAHLIEQGCVVPRGDGLALGPHTFEVWY